MGQILNINKPVGITSYDVIRKLKKEYPGQKIGHAGTLDPLAGGVLICLVGKEANKRQSELMNVDKEYVFEVLFGFETDTYDVLGKVERYVEYAPGDVLERLDDVLPQFTGELEQKVPPFSAVKIDGKPLYRWFLEGEIDEVEIPTKIVYVDSISLNKHFVARTDDLRNDIFEVIDKVRSGFRQKEVRAGWRKVLSVSNMPASAKFLIVEFKAVVSKGTYVRAIAHDLGQKLGTGACTLNITRTRVGGYRIEDSVAP